MTQQDGGVGFAVKVVPGSSRNRIIGALGDALKLAVSKPPRAGAANAAVIQLIASALSVPVSAVRIVRGHANSRKQIHVSGITVPQVAERLRAAM